MTVRYPMRNSRDIFSARNLLFEVLVEAKLARALDGVADQSWEPTTHKAAQTTLLDSDGKAGSDALVLGRVNLHVALDHVQGCHGCVSEATAEHST